MCLHLHHRQLYDVYRIRHLEEPCPVGLVVALFPLFAPYMFDTLYFGCKALTLAVAGLGIIQTVGHASAIVL